MGDHRHRNPYGRPGPIPSTASPAGLTTPAVLRARTADHRLGYLGDWHSHPHDVGHSRTDLASLALISIKMPLQPNPTQIVVRRTDHGFHTSMPDASSP